MPQLGMLAVDSIQSLGGKARAYALSSEERADIAKKAAEARWNLPRAAYGDANHPLVIGDTKIPCYVLEDGRRVIVQSALISSIGLSEGSARGKGHSDRLASFAHGKRINGFIAKDLLILIESPVKFIHRKGISYGYDATVLAGLCEAVIAADDDGALQPQQKHLARKCRALHRGFARVGIIALIDEATGYQQVRAKHELARILEAYISPEFLPWTKRFPDAFYQQLFRLKGWQYDPPSVKRPISVGLLTNKLVYEKLPKGVLEELKRKTPKSPRGNYTKRLHQSLTQSVGNPHLEKHLASVITLMRVSDTYRKFYNLFVRAFCGQTEMEFDSEEERKSHGRRL